MSWPKTLQAEEQRYPLQEQSNNRKRTRTLNGKRNHTSAAIALCNRNYHVALRAVLSVVMHSLQPSQTNPAKDFLMDMAEKATVDQRCLFIYSLREMI